MSPLSLAEKRDVKFRTTAASAGRVKIASVERTTTPASSGIRTRRTRLVVKLPPLGLNRESKDNYVPKVRTGDRRVSAGHGAFPAGVRRNSCEWINQAAGHSA
jgi:hypothetical protein